MDSPKIPWPIELVKILIWPAFAFFVVIGFWEPLHSVARLMPDVLKETENITIGDVKISIRSTIATRVPIKVSPILPKLSPKTIEYILEHSPGDYFSDIPKVDPEEIELISSGLCRKMTDAELAEPKKNEPSTGGNVARYEKGYKCEGLYTETRNFLMAFIPELMKQAAAKNNKREGTN